MRTRFFVVAASFAALLAFAFASNASASAPIHESVTLDSVTFPDAYLSAACGQAVLDTVSGRLTATLFSASGTTPAHEVDTLTGGTITYSSPSTGNSVTRPLNGTSQAVYPDGLAVGAPAIVTITGVNSQSITGEAPPGSGQLVADATILLIDDAGVPGTAFAPSDIVSLNGTYAASTAAICAALG
jgi:hypothetical protein